MRDKRVLGIVLLIVVVAILGVCAYQSLQRQITDLQVIVCELYIDRLSEETSSATNNNAAVYQ